MTYKYYPGCTLRTKAKELDEYARKSMEALGVQASEPEDWQCCGAVYPLGRDEVASRLAAIRVLVDARDEGKAVLTLCSACHHVLKRVNHDMRTDGDIRRKVNNYLGLSEPYEGETEVTHFMEMLRDDVGFEGLKKKVKVPLSGRKIGAYYGCMLLRPGDVMAFDDAEDPRLLESFISALGAEPAVFSKRNECCGSYGSFEDKPAVRRLSCAVLESAKEKGAQALVTACPLCRYNLGQNDLKEIMPVQYFTELLAEALGVK